MEALPQTPASHNTNTHTLQVDSLNILFVYFMYSQKFIFSTPASHKRNTPSLQIHLLTKFQLQLKIQNEHF